MEKTLFSQTAEVKGKGTANSFTATFQFVPSEEKLKQTRGTLFFLSQVQNDSEDRALSINRELFENFRGKFYQAGGSNLKALEEALENSKEVLGKQEVKAEILAVTLWGTVLYVAKSGNTGLVLARGGVAKKIDFSKVASGVLADKDTIFLADKEFLNTATLETLSRVSEKADFEEAIVNLQNESREKEGTALAVRLFVQEPIEGPQAVLIADLDEQKETDGELPVSGSRKIPLRWPVWRPNVGFLQKIWLTLKMVFAKVAPFVKEYSRRAAFIILSPWLPRPPGVLEDEAQRKRKRVAQVVAVLITILLVSILVGAVNRTRRSGAEKRESTIAAVEKKLTEAESLKNSNKANAASLVEEAESALNTLSNKDPKVASLRAHADTLLVEINRIYTASLETFADLSSQKGGVETKKLKVAGTALLVLDTGTGSVYKVDLKSKEPSVLVSEKKDLQNIAASQDFLYIQSKDGIKRVDIQTKTEKNQADSSQKWQKIVGADTYKDNLYLLDAGAKQIWKYVPAAAALVGPQTYLTESFSETPVGFAVDGSVWVATKTELFKFFGGKKQKNEVKDLPRSFSEIADLYTREGLANLYVLDKGEGGVFVIEKASGNYSALYTDDKLKEATSIAVDEANKTAYVLAGNTVYSFKLK